MKKEAVLPQESQKKFHLNRSTGEIAPCRASVRPCPVGGSEVHFPTVLEAATAYEKLMEHQALPPAVPRPKRSALPAVAPLSGEAALRERYRRIVEAREGDRLKFLERARLLPELLPSAGEKSTFLGRGRGDLAAARRAVEDLHLQVGDYEAYMAGLRNLRSALSWRRGERGPTLEGREFHPENAARISHALVKFMEEEGPKAYYLQEDGLHGMDEELVVPTAYAGEEKEPLQEEFSRRSAALTPLEKAHAVSIMGRASDRFAKASRSGYFVSRGGRLYCGGALLRGASADFKRCEELLAQGRRPEATEALKTVMSFSRRDFTEEEHERARKLYIKENTSMVGFVGEPYGQALQQPFWGEEAARYTRSATLDAFRQAEGSFLPLPYRYHYDAMGNFCSADGSVLVVGAQQPPEWQAYQPDARSAVRDG